MPPAQRKWWAGPHGTDPPFATSDAGSLGHDALNLLEPATARSEGLFSLLDGSLVACSLCLFKVSFEASNGVLELCGGASGACLEFRVAAVPLSVLGVAYRLLDRAHALVEAGHIPTGNHAC